MSYEVSPMGVVGTIRDSIQGVDGFSIVKELIQNADDSGATKWVLGLHDGFPAARHPLLRSRGMFVVNDGAFRREHAKALVQLHLSGKAGDQESIGKFGVGLKSVYHLGEAFFYLGLDSSPDAFAPPYGVTGFVSPWVLANEHPDSRREWNLDARQRHDDEIAIRDAVLEACGWKGFTLWIPLRTRAQCQLGDGKQALIQSRFFDGDDYPRDIFRHDLEERLSRLWPMLRNLETIRVIGPEKATQISLRLRKGSTRRRYPQAGADGASALPLTPDRLQGYIDGGASPMLFAGLEGTVPELLELRGHPHWPTSLQVTEVANMQVPDKSVPHVAAVFSVHDATSGGGSLTLDWSVFLPILDEHGEQRKIDGDLRVQLNLHGYFFLSTDRTRILDWRIPPTHPLEDEKAVQRYWNAELARRGTLPAILDALEALKQQLRQDGRRGAEVYRILRAITAGLAGTALFAEWRTAITRERTWLWKLDASGRANWQLVEDGQDILVCPDLEQLVELFGAHIALSQRSVTDAQHPLLSPQEPSKRWDRQLLVELLRAVNQEYLARPEGQRAMLRFLEAQELCEEAAPLADTLRGVLGEVIARQWRNLDASDQEALRGLLRFVPEDERIAIPRSTPPSVIEALLERRLRSVVAFPEALGLPATPKLEVGDAHRILAACDGRQATHALVKAVIAATDGERRTTLLDTVKRFKLFPVSAASDGSGLASAEELHQAASQRRFFERSTNQFSIVPALQACLADISLVQIDSETAELLGLAPEKTDKTAAFRLLARVPAVVREAAPRIELVARLVDPNGHLDGDNRILRYLLHGDSSAFDNTNATLFLPDRHHDEAGAIAEAILSERGESWRWLGERELIDAALTPAVLERRGVRRADLAGLKELLQETVGKGAFPVLDDNLCDYLLAKIDDVSLLRALPIHQARDGSRVSLTDDAWIESEYFGTYQGNSELLQGILLIRKHPTLFRQQESLGLAPFQATAVVRRALKSDTPDAFWSDIMAALPHVSRTSIGSQLRGVAWLRKADGSAVRPEQILRIPEVSDLALGALRLAGSDLVIFEQLDDGIRSHANVQDLIEKVLPSREEALDGLGAVLGAMEAYWVGDLNGPATEDPAPDDAADPWSATAWLEVVGEGPSPFVARELLARLPTDCDRIWPHLQRPIPLSQCFRALEHLRERHAAEASASRKEAILELHNRYLQLAVGLLGWSLRDPSIRMLSQAGEWMKPSELCHGQLGVSRSFLIDEAQATILGSQRVPAHDLGEARPRRILPRSAEGWANVSEDLAETAEMLREYFGEWSTHVKRPMVGGLLALMGDDPGVRRLAAEWLDTFTIENVRSGFDAEPAERLARQPNTLPEKIEKNRFIVRVESAPTFEVENLVGTVLTVEREANPDTLIAGTKETEGRDGTYYVGLRFHRVDPSVPSTLDALLRNTARFLYRSIYAIPLANVEHTFDVLATSEQLELEVIQDLCLDSAFHYMHGQLGARSPALDVIFRKWNAAQYSRAELRRLTGSKGGDTGPDLQEPREELRKRIEEDPETAAVLLAAVRKKMKAYEYRPDSIPFELMQNADDALAERHTLDPVTPLNRRLAINIGSDFVELMHWGRPINFGPRDLDYHRDLEKMLTINASDKGDGVTGKFGLGFKSVFLLTDRPAVISRDLAFEVIGGVYPQRLPASEVNELRHRVERPGDKDGTLIRLEAPPHAVQDATERFLKLAPLTLLFMREIDEIELRDATSEVRTLHVRAQSIPIPDAWLRRMPDGSRVLLLGDDNVTIALRMDGERFTAFPGEPPDVWITMPTRTRVGLGFLLQGRFDPDVGRGQLATSSETNLEMARKGAPAILRALMGLSAMAADQLGVTLGLVSPPSDDFWSSLFEALATGIHHQNRTQDAVQVAWTVLWGEDGAARRWIESRPALPTFLPGPYSARSRLGDVSFVVRGALADSRIFRIVATSPAFQVAYPPGKVIATGVAARLRELAVPLDAADVTLVDAVGTILGPDVLVTPGKAETLAPLVDPSILEVVDPAELDAVRERLGRARFKSQASTYECGADLSPNQGDGDGPLLVAIAPKDRVLADDYGKPSLRLFEFCCGDTYPDLRTVAGWVRDCETDTARLAALDYLLSGPKGHAVASFFLAGRTSGTWLEEVDEFTALASEKKHRLRELLSLDAAPVPDAEDEPMSVSLVSNDARELFEIVYRRWKEREARLVEQYEDETYPWRPEIRADYDPLDPEQRRGWLTILLLGAMFGLGRVQPEQNRDFLKHCEEQGWMETFITAGMPGNDRAETDRRWMSVIEGHLKLAEENDLQEYRNWFRLFVTIYQMSTWLDDYATLILGLEWTESDQDFQGQWSPNTSARLSGSGISAPPLDRALRLGKHFVIRELRRMNVLTNRKLDRHAFVTSGRVKELFARILRALPGEDGQASAAVYRELVQVLGEGRATFDGGYDLPFQFDLHEAQP